MADNTRFIVHGTMSDGQPGYWGRCPGGDWWADRNRAKVYKSRAAASRIALDFGGEVVQLTSKVKNQSVYVYDLLLAVKQLRTRATVPADWANPDYLTYHRGAQHAYREASKIIEALLEEQGIDVETELGFVA